MPAKPETNLIQRVHRALDSSIYAEKTNNPYRAGMPDVYYEGKGPSAMAWIEYKFRPVKPRMYTFEQAFELATAHQQKWMRRAMRNGKKVAMIIGFKDSLEAIFVTPALKSWCTTTAQIAEHIYDCVYEDVDDLLTRRSAN